MNYDGIVFLYLQHVSVYEAIEYPTADWESVRVWKGTVIHYRINNDNYNELQAMTFCL